MTTTATVEPDAVTPRIRIDTTETVVYRVQDGERVQVRGMVVAGVVYDYEVPQGVPLTYQAGADTTAAVEMPDLGVWLIPLGQPELGVRLTLGSMPEWTRSAPGSVTAIPGRENPVVVSWARQGRTGQISTVALEADEFAALSACLDVAGPMYLSFSPRHWVANGLVSPWVVVGDVTETPTGVAVGQATWTVSLPLTPVDRPEFITDASLSWSNLPSTWGALAASWDTLEGA